jgi:hypothetical protein
MVPDPGDCPAAALVVRCADRPCERSRARGLPDPSRAQRSISHLTSVLYSLFECMIRPNAAPA